ncbi:MAG: hypothetical protein JNN01_02380, partial [Opitutaceae bacterium]|nr:hypothetical protein [Opitutaceae bacterium]
LPIERATLDPRVIYTVPVSPNRVTTVSFPGAIAAIDAAGVSTDAKVPGFFQLAHVRGSSFFSVLAMGSGVSGNLNVRWGKNTYVLEVVESPRPVLSLVFEEEPKAGGGGEVQRAPKLSAIRLLALLDKAKNFALLKTGAKDVVSQVDFATLGESATADFGDYSICIEEAYRFNPEDTLVFRVVLRNRTDAEIRYRPDSFAVRVGSRIFAQSISDGTGLVPPRSETVAYFAITGTPDGGRNELSLKNDFRVLIERLPNPAPVAGVPLPQEGE